MNIRCGYLSSVPYAIAACAPCMRALAVSKRHSEREVPYGAS